jgi:hypothetical protein
LETRIRGWLPKEPAIPCNQRTKMAETNPNNSQRKLFKISLVANAIILNIFLLAHLLIDPFNSNIEYAVTSWTIFILSLISVNFLLYKYFNRKTSSQLEKLRQ